MAFWVHGYIYRAPHAAAPQRAAGGPALVEGMAEVIASLLLPRYSLPIRIHYSWNSINNSKQTLLFPHNSQVIAPIIAPFPTIPTAPAASCQLPAASCLVACGVVEVYDGEVCGLDLSMGPKGYRTGYYPVVGHVMHHRHARPPDLNNLSSKRKPSAISRHS